MTSDMNRALSVLVFATLARCRTTGSQPGQRVSVQFGILRAVGPANLESTGVAGTGADCAAPDCTGTDGDRSELAYTVEVADGTTTRIVTDRREIRVGDCVAVERLGEFANIRRASANYCDPAAAASPTS
jgi:hypothetical protein